MKFKNIQDRIDKYSEIIDEDAIGGHHAKTFIRIDDNTDKFESQVRKGKSQSEKKCVDSEFFAELFETLSKRNSHYVTYLNDSVCTRAKDRYIPKYVSCLRKFSERNDGYYGEIVGCKLANLCEVDTVYNIVSQSENELFSEGEIYPNFNYIVSVDYVSYGERTEDMASLGLRFNEDSSLSWILERFDYMLPKFAEARSWNLQEETIQKFKEDFVRMYIFRSLICEDFDYEAKNIGIIDTEQGDFRLAPCFDMELFFKGQRSQRYYGKYAMENINFAMEHFPEVTKRIAHILKTNLDNGTIQNIMENSVPLRPDTLKRYKNIVFKNIKFLDDFVHGRIKKEDLDYDML